MLKGRVGGGGEPAADLQASTTNLDNIVSAAGIAFKTQQNFDGVAITNTL